MKRYLDVFVAILAIVGVGQGRPTNLGGSPSLRGRLGPAALPGLQGEFSPLGTLGPIGNGLSTPGSMAGPPPLSDSTDLGHPTSFQGGASSFGGSPDSGGRQGPGVPPGMPGAFGSPADTVTAIGNGINTLGSGGGSPLGPGSSGPGRGGSGSGSATLPGGGGPLTGTSTGTGALGTSRPEGPSAGAGPRGGNSLGRPASQKPKRPRKMSKEDAAAIGLGVASSAFALGALAAGIYSAVQQRQRGKQRGAGQAGAAGAAGEAGAAGAAGKPVCVGNSGRVRRSIPTSKVSAEVLDRIPMNFQHLY